jgi:MFS family permease
VSGSYRSLLAIPHSRAFVLAGFVGRLPMAMRDLGCVLMISELTGSYWLAGATTGTLTLAQAAASPRLGRLVDRHGQRRVLLACLAIHAVGTLVLVASAQFSAPAWILLASAALAGAATLPVGSLVRSRWSALVGDSPDLEKAYALESSLDEAIYVLGPLIVTGLVVGVVPSAGLLGALVLTASGSLTLVAQRRTEPAVTAEQDRTDGRVIRVPGLLVLVATLVAVGAIFGAVDVAMVAFAEEAGSSGAVGPLLALYAAGSLVAGLAYGARSWRTPLHRRFLVSLAGLFGGTGLIALAHSVPLMALAVTVAGVAIAPTLIAGFRLAQKLAPPSALTEGLNWVSTALTVGGATGYWSAGLVADQAGGRMAFLVAVIAGGTAMLVASRWRNRLLVR